MFEKYNEKARRALFFARYEASKLGSKVIESEHLLLGILREGEEIIKEIFSRFNVKPEQIRREVEGDRLFVDRISSSAELPLSETPCPRQRVGFQRRICEDSDEVRVVPAVRPPALGRFPTERLRLDALPDAT